MRGRRRTPRDTGTPRFDRFEDWRERLLAAVRREPPIPHAKTLLPTAGSHFARIGRHLLNVLVQVGGLGPGDRVLDLGCGPGRVARPLTRYLSSGGSYEGLDVVRPAIEWCQRTITPRHPNFRFSHADVYNAAYNPSGRWIGSEYRFPYPDSEFDFAFTTSLFTHMLPEDVGHYLRETARVLRPGGRCLNTFFLLTDAAGGGDPLRGASRDFRHEGPGYRTDSLEVHERAVAYDETVVRRMHERAGLVVVEPVLYGRWAGARGPSDQDVVVAAKGS